MNPAAEPLPPHPSSSKSKLLFFGFIFVLGGALLLWTFKPFSSAATLRFQVHRGVPARTIAHDLRAQGLLSSPWSFLVWVKIFGHPGALKPGVYELSTRDSGLSIFRKLRQGPPLVRVTFPEGWTCRQMAELLEARGVTPAVDFLALVNKEKREGFLFPDTYFFEQGLQPDEVIARLTARFKEKVPKDFKERAQAMKLSYGQLVTLASIVEKEARAPQERPLIAGVFLNRLRKHWYLESCATVEYALGSWKAHLMYKDLQVVSPYNTYRHPGLPPGPICNPGAAALDAAAHPAQTDMMFFVADGSGTHRFSRYYKEHLEIQLHGKGQRVNDKW
jgi:UPF0755 protein